MRIIYCHENDDDQNEDIRSFNKMKKYPQTAQIHNIRDIRILFTTLFGISIFISRNSN